MVKKKKTAAKTATKKIDGGNGIPTILLKKISEIIPNPENPRLIKDENFKRLVKSIKDFPEMLNLRPLIIDENNMVLGGNMRLRALQELKFLVVPTLRAKDLTEAQKREFIIKDNVPYGEWDFDALANAWNQDDLEEWGVDLPDFESGEINEESSDYSSRFEIVVECKDETDQEKTYNNLIEKGYRCRVLTL